MSAPALRPMGVGDIVDRVITIYRADLQLFLLISAVPNLALILLTNGFRILFPNAFVALDDLTGFMGDGNAALRLMREIDPVPGVVLALLSVPPFFIAVGALTKAAAARSLSRPITVPAALRAGLRAAPKLIGSTLAAVLAFGVGWGALFALSIALVTLTGIGALAIVPFLVAFLVPIVVFSSWVIAWTVGTLEPAGPISSLRRSWELLAGHRLRALALLTLMLILQLVITAVFGLLLIGPLVANPAVGRIASAVVSGLIQIAWEPLPWIALTLLYTDLRIRKEGFDLQLAAEALPRGA